MQFVVIFGPPAVGKMTVGHELAGLTGFKLFHNHMTVDPIVDIFEFGSPPFGRLVNEIRRMVIQEAADSGLPGLIFTFVWALDDPGDTRMLESYLRIVADRGGQTRFVELFATQAERLGRNASEFRLERKRPHRDLAFSRNLLLDLDDRYVMNTGAGDTAADALLAGHRHLKIDNSALSAAEAAARIARAFGLPIHGA